MKRIPLPSTRTGVVLAAVALIATACGGGASKTSTSSTAPGSTTSSTSAGGTSTASGVGIANGQLTVGNVAILSGPVPGLFKGAPFGADAFFAYQNSLGGVNGLRVKVQSEDDAFSCAQNQSETQALSTQAFAFVGSFSLFDNCGAKVLQANPDIPDVAYSLDPVAQALPNNFSPQPLEHGWRTGPLSYFKQHYPNAIKSVGTLVANVPSATSSWANEKAAMQSMGYRVTYERTYNPLDTDFTADVVRMRSSGVQALFLDEGDVKTVARVLNAANQQGWKPQLVAPGATMYDGSFFKLVNPGAAEGAFGDQLASMYLGQDRSVVPEVNLFLTWLNKTHPGFQPDVFALFGWTSARLFTQALQQAGPNPTRQNVLAALRSIHSFDSNGIIPAADPAGKHAPQCWLNMQVKNGKFVRTSPSPPSGFICNPGGYFVNPATG